MADADKVANREKSGLPHIFSPILNQGRLAKGSDAFSAGGEEEGEDAAVEVEAGAAVEGGDLEARLHPGEGDVAEAVPDGARVHVLGPVEGTAAARTVEVEGRDGRTARRPPGEVAEHRVEVVARGARVERRERELIADAHFVADV